MTLIPTCVGQTHVFTAPYAPADTITCACGALTAPLVHTPPPVYYSSPRVLTDAEMQHVHEHGTVPPAEDEHV